MKRAPEPELMNTERQARAYAMADFNNPNWLFVEYFKNSFSEKEIIGTILDLGCGPADITLRFARLFPKCHIHGVDGAESMLKYGQAAVTKAVLANRIRLIHGCLPDVRLPLAEYDAIVSNNLLHHLASPMALWEIIKTYSKRGAPIMIMDIIRPGSKEEAGAIVEKYMGDESAILKKDFFSSLLAAYRVKEVQEQLRQADLVSHLSIGMVTRIQMVVKGIIS
ncbi:MAG: class I SAM-dependent methyltransferase [Deltaproteobacteria bacterium]|nr:class I SAM-dependent methyltransferase [Deltaproteobacteria bacterium]MDL1960374.1 class I SAM-dependent methyltransferase [Deltaproteobacteria bacterium]